MTDTSVIEGNELICEFDGGRRKQHPKNEVEYFYSLNGYNYDNWALKYHSSWDWLMPVVEKINALQVPEDSRGDVTYVVTIEPGYCVISAGGEGIVSEEQAFGYCVISAGGEGIVSEEQAFDSGEPLIATVYRAIVNFVNWHNSQKEVNNA